jgi:flagellar biosynthesis protein
MAKANNKDSGLHSPASPRVAVALRYDGASDAAPRLAASGKGPIAERIIALAKEQSIPLHEDPELAALLVDLELDSFIPIEAFAAVAEILSYIYRQNGKLQQEARRS